MWIRNGAVMKHKAYLYDLNFARVHDLDIHMLQLGFKYLQPIFG